jgi:hypothetical protein
MRFTFISGVVSTCALRAPSLSQRFRNQATSTVHRKFLVVDSDQHEDACYSLQRTVERVSTKFCFAPKRMILGLVMKV